MALPKQLIDIERIYLEPAVESYARGREILEKFPDAERIPVASHWNIPSLHGNEGSAEDWLRIKRGVLVLGVKKSLTQRPNGRSAHFIAPSTSNGCAMACAYCYVPRRKGYANPISIFVNIEEIGRSIARHAARQGPLPAPDQIDPKHSGSTTSARTAICRSMPPSPTTSGTSWPCSAASRTPRARSRPRPSTATSSATTPEARPASASRLMPEKVAKVVDVRTSSMPSASRRSTTSCAPATRCT